MKYLLRSRILSIHPWTALLLFLSLHLVAQTESTFSQPNQGPDVKRPFYVIDVEDSIEVGLIEQQLKLHPVVVRGRSFYFYGDEKILEQLRGFGYEPVRVNPNDVLSQVVIVPRKQAREENLVQTGATIVLREREYWVVRASRTQLQLIGRLGFAVQELGRREPRPRQVRIPISGREQIAKVAALRVDIYSTSRSDKGYVILGGAFDDNIDELRAAGFEVEILPDPPGVIR